MIRPARAKFSPDLADIVENAERIEGYLADMDREGFERDGRTRDAVERCLERVCEAVHRLGERAAELIPGQPWGDIRGPRSAPPTAASQADRKSDGSRLRHAYDRISLDVIWNAVRHDLPGLAADARRALERLQAGRSDAG